MHASRTGRTVMAAVLAALAACSDDTTNLDATAFEAVLNGTSERPTPVTTTASGTATFTYNGTSLTFDVDYAGVSGNPTAAHIHVGAPNGTGSARLFLCGTGGSVPWPGACPSATTGEIAGTATATHLNGATLDEVVHAMRTYNAYVNIHTGTNAGGEIRGNIVRAP